MFSLCSDKNNEWSELKCLYAYKPGPNHFKALVKTPTKDHMIMTKYNMSLQF